MASAGPIPRQEERMGRSGGVLLLVLGIVSLVLSTVVLATATFRARLRLTHDALRREETRDGLLVCVSNAIALLLADDNGVDHLGESWAAPLASPPLRGMLLDESARIPLATADTNLLAQLLGTDSPIVGTDSSVFDSRVPSRVYAASSQALVDWRSRWTSDHGGEAPPSLAFYLDALAAGDRLMHSALGDRLSAFGTPFGVGPVNLNTASPAVVAAVLRASGATADLADEMAAHLVDARASGAIAAASGRRTLAALLVGPGRPPTAAEAAVLAAAEPHFGCSSDLFRGRFESLSPAVALEFVYDRAARRFLLWDEGPVP